MYAKAASALFRTGQKDHLPSTDPKTNLREAELLLEVTRQVTGLSQDLNREAILQNLRPLVR